MLRDLNDVLFTILAIPGLPPPLRSRLELIQAKAEWTCPETQGPLWIEAGCGLEAELAGAAEGVREAVREIFTGRRPVAAASITWVDPPTDPSAGCTSAEPGRKDYGYPKCVGGAEGRGPVAIPEGAKGA